MFICGRVIAGVGIGFLNTIILPWVTELSQTHNRGSSFSVVFVANFLGIAISSCINFGMRTSETDLRWRLPLGVMIIPLVIVFFAVLVLPESPRYVGRHLAIAGIEAC